MRREFFNVATIATTVAEKTFSGPMFDEIKAAFPKAKFFDRTSMNTWEDKAVIQEVNRIGKSRIVMAGLWTSVCIVGPPTRQGRPFVLRHRSLSWLAETARHHIRRRRQGVRHEG
jgi:hypothetical protein